MQKIYLLLLSIFLFSTIISAQPELEIVPEEIQFSDIFDRLENMYFINEGNQTLIIDSVGYLNDALYFLRSNNYSQFPIYIAPGDSILLDCILSAYFMVTQSDSADTMYVYSNSINGLEYVEIAIDFFEEFQEGEINGFVLENDKPVGNTNLYFYYEGIYPIALVKSDPLGFYSIELPPGNYTIAAEKDSFYTTFYNNTFDPFTATHISLGEDSLVNVDITLTREIETGFSISGIIQDSSSLTPLNRGVVVVRKGKHTPDNKPGIDSLPEFSYTAIVNNDGTYSVNNIMEEDYYFIQSFSDYYVPTYYSSGGSSLFWQGADSIYINSELNNYTIKMPRDSALGGGIVNGQILFQEGRIENVEEVVVYATSLDFNYAPFTYTLPVQEGNYTMINLPYGNYRLRAQKIGLEDTYSQDIKIVPGNIYIDNINLTFTITEVKEDNLAQVPDELELYQNYPNPFNPATNIEFYLPHSSEIVLKVTNILGEEVAVLKNGYLKKGKYSAKFDGSNLSSGTYIVTLITEKTTSSRKILLLK